MMKRFKVSTKGIDNRSICYLLEIHLEDKVLVKVGITSRSIEERVVEILTSVFTSYRYFPYCRPKRFKRVEDALLMEQTILDTFKDFKYTPSSSFGGSTELLDIPLDTVVELYDSLVTGGVNES